MGILDDAIREHLELIRRRGAADSEVQRLEDEAFGPPTRPDEADFPESEELSGPSGNGVAVEAAVEEPGPEEPAASEDVTTLLPAEEAEEAGRGLEEPTGAHIAEEPESEEILVGDEEEEPVAEPGPEEPAAEEHPIVEESADEAPAPLEEATSLYDQSRDEPDADLDLDLDEQAPPAEPPSEEHPVAEPEGATPLEPPIESLDTVEHPFHEEIVEEEEPHEEASPSEEYPVEDEAAAQEEPTEEPSVEEDEEGDDEDVLADTPEFLKDAPEDDELWFEQGEPKDFDF